MAVLLGFAACNGAQDKEAQLKELKAQQTELQEKIAALEGELKSEGNTVATQKRRCLYRWRHWSRTRFGITWKYKAELISTKTCL
ncbi:hypothetical protein GCM10028895_30990 [Pontibacter rugosus]